MGAAEDRQKNSTMAAHLKQAGYPHGRRKSGPYPHSGGLLADLKGERAGSAKYQRLMEQRGAE